jgi:DNA topoisomerase-1
MDSAANVGEAKKNISQAVATVACLLGNTPAICRRCYVHPAIIEAYLEQHLDNRKLTFAAADNAPNNRGLSRNEKLLLSFLQQHAAQSA